MDAWVHGRRCGVVVDPALCAVTRWWPDDCGGACVDCCVRGCPGSVGVGMGRCHYRATADLRGNRSRGDRSPSGHYAVNSRGVGARGAQCPPLVFPLGRRACVNAVGARRYSRYRVGAAYWYTQCLPGLRVGGRFCAWRRVDVDRGAGPWAGFRAGGVVLDVWGCSCHRRSARHSVVAAGTNGLGVRGYWVALASGQANARWRALCPDCSVCHYAAVLGASGNARPASDGYGRPPAPLFGYALGVFSGGGNLLGRIRGLLGPDPRISWRVVQRRCGVLAVSCGQYWFRGGLLPERQVGCATRRSPIAGTGPCRSGGAFPPCGGWWS